MLANREVCSVSNDAEKQESESIFILHGQIISSTPEFSNLLSAHTRAPECKIQVRAKQSKN